MNKQQILDLISKASGVPLSDIVVKERAGRQIKANALFEGSSSPANPRSSIGVFFATDSPDLALDGALRRMSLDFPFPEAVVVLNVEARTAHIYGYADSDVGINIAKAIDGEFEAVPRPAFVREVKPAGSLDATELERQLRACPNVILQGPPGTGKSSIALELVRSYTTKVDNLTSEQCRFGSLLSKYSSFDALMTDTDGLAFKAPIVWDMVQLHAGYGYDDLVRRVSPVSKSEHLHFEVQDRLFPKLCALAASRTPDRPVLLILDEINRCNLAATLGECVFAIDPSHRNTPVRLQYQGSALAPSLIVPPNLWIVGTMNTADRSIAMVDYAIRRRFRFMDIPADGTALETWYATNETQADLAGQLFAAANIDLRPAVMVSHSAFMIPPLPLNSWAARMARQVTYYVLPLLNEYSREGLRPQTPFRWDGDEFDLESGDDGTTRLTEALEERLKG